jgi:hypothetical protein
MIEIFENLMPGISHDSTDYGRRIRPGVQRGMVISAMSVSVPGSRLLLAAMMARLRGFTLAGGCSKGEELPLMIGVL